MASRGGKAKKNAAKTPQRDWISRDSSGQDSAGSRLTTVQLWWKEFESEAKNAKLAAQGSDAPQPEFKTSNDPKEHWYGVSTDYWEHVEATDDGMLGGFAAISNSDLVGSFKFLLPMLQGKEPSLKHKVGNTKAIDIGSGIGRITKGLLSKLFTKTDLMEQNPTFLERSKTEVDEVKAGDFFQSSVQDFGFDGAPYDVIWMQWVLLYSIDSDLVEFLKRAKKALAPNGVIVIKENHTREGKGFYVDKDDNSITRSEPHFKSIFDSAGLTIVKEERVTDFPKELFPVTMWALQ